MNDKADTGWDVQRELRSGDPGQILDFLARGPKPWESHAPLPPRIEHDAAGGQEDAAEKRSAREPDPRRTGTGAAGQGQATRQLIDALATTVMQANDPSKAGRAALATLRQTIEYRLDLLYGRKRMTAVVEGPDFEHQALLDALWHGADPA